jgi:hypothetical protein
MPVSQLGTITMKSRPTLGDTKLRLHFAYQLHRMVGAVEAWVAVGRKASPGGVEQPIAFAKIYFTSLHTMSGSVDRLGS